MYFYKCIETNRIPLRVSFQSRRELDWAISSVNLSRFWLVKSFCSLLGQYVKQEERYTATVDKCHNQTIVIANIGR